MPLLRDWVFLQLFAFLTKVDYAAQNFNDNNHTMIYPKGVLLALTAMLSVRSNPHHVSVAVRNKTHLERARGIGWGFKDLDDMYALSSLGWWYNWCAPMVVRTLARCNRTRTGE